MRTDLQRMLLQMSIGNPTRALLRALTSRSARETMQREWHVERGQMWPDPTDANDEAILEAIIETLADRIDSGGRPHGW